MNPIYNINTTDAGLKNTQLTAIAIPIMQQQARGLAACVTMGSGNATVDGGMTYLTPVISTSGAMLTNPTNFQNGNVTIQPGTIAGAHIARVGHVSRNEINLGFTREHLVGTLVRNYVSDLIALATATITAGNFGASLGTVTATNFDESKVELLVDRVAGQPRCILTSSKSIHGVRANLFREGGKWITPGVEGGVWEMSLAAASNNASAVIATPEAIAAVVALPPGLKLQMGDDLTITPLQVDGLGTAGFLVTWLDRGTRAEWMSVEAVVGFAPGQSTALRFVASA